MFPLQREVFYTQRTRYKQIEWSLRNNVYEVPTALESPTNCETTRINYSQIPVSEFVILLFLA